MSEFGGGRSEVNNPEIKSPDVNETPSTETGGEASKATKDVIAEQANKTGGFENYEEAEAFEEADEEDGDLSQLDDESQNFGFDHDDNIASKTIVDADTSSQKEQKLTFRQYVQYIAAKNGYSNVKDALALGTAQSLLTAAKIYLSAYDLDAPSKTQLRKNLEISEELLQLKKEMSSLELEIGQCNGEVDKKVLTKLLAYYLKDYTPPSVQEYPSAEIRSQKEFGIEQGFDDNEMIIEIGDQTYRIDIPKNDELDE